MESTVCINTLSLFRNLTLVKIDDFPSLVGSSMFVPELNLLSFHIFSASDIKDLSALSISVVDKEFTFILDLLEPDIISRANTCKIHLARAEVTFNSNALVISLASDT